MRYMQDGGFQNNPLMRLTLSLTLALLVAFWVTNIAMYFSRMTLRPASVVSYYKGSDEDFRAPRSVESMLETTHMHLPMMGMVLLFLTHLLIFIPMSRGAKVGIIVAAFVSALIEESAGWLVRFVSPSFALLKVAGFVGLQTAFVVLIASVASFLLRAARRPSVIRRAGARPGAVAASPEGEGAARAAYEYE